MPVRSDAVRPFVKALFSEIAAFMSKCKKSLMQDGYLMAVMRVWYFLNSLNGIHCSCSSAG